MNSLSSPTVLASKATILCREGYCVSPGNADSELPKAATRMKPRTCHSNGDCARRFPGSVLIARRPLLAAMQKAEVKLLKLGYFQINNRAEDYWTKADEIRRKLEAWSKLVPGYA